MTADVDSTWKCHNCHRVLMSRHRQVATLAMGCQRGMSFVKWTETENGRVQTLKKVTGRAGITRIFEWTRSSLVTCKSVKWLSEFDMYHWCTFEAIIELELCFREQFHRWPVSRFYHCGCCSFISRCYRVEIVQTFHVHSLHELFATHSVGPLNCNCIIHTASCNVFVLDFHRIHRRGQW